MGLLRSQAAARGRQAANKNFSAPKAHLTAVEIAVILTAAIALLAIAVLAHRIQTRRTANALRERCGYQLLPANSFDPSPEDVLRHATALARVRPASGRAPRAARAAQIRLVTGDGKINYQLWGPAAARSVLAGRTYHGVELRLLHPLPEPEAAEDSAETPATDLPPAVEPTWPGAGDPLAETRVFDRDTLHGLL